jgi:hypothetical protein
MHSISRPRLLGFVILAVVLLCGCETAKIADINRDPARYAGREITVAGEITNSFGALGQGAFEIDDGTGRLWVISGGFGVPTKGARVAVTGRIQQGVTLGSQSFANVLRESRPRR